MDFSKMRRLAGLAPRHSSQLREGDGENGYEPADSEDDEEGGEGEEDEPIESEEQSDDTDVSKDQWEQYRGMQERALGLAKENAAMLRSLSGLQEDGMPVVQRKALRGARRAIGEALKAQKEAYRKISEYGSMLLGK